MAGHHILSAVLCGAATLLHCHSDVVQGRVIGAGVAPRLHPEPAFRADLEVAKRELAALRAQGAKPSRDCAAEAAALKT